MTTMEKTVTLNSGGIMPLVGLGCWQSPPGQVENAVEAALNAGYRHIDTAYNYLNEGEVGEGLRRWMKNSGGKRREVFVVSKLPMIGMYEGGVEKYLKKSVKKMKLDYLDLYLVHLPVGMKGKHDEDVFPMTKDGKFVLNYGTDIIAVWREMEKMQNLGLTKSIGLSNFNVKQIKKICAIAKVQPAVHQVELHAQFQQREMQEFCKTNKIALTAYAPLGSPGRSSKGLVAKHDIPDLLNDPLVKLVAGIHSVTTAQVLIRFLVQQGIIAIPKSVTPTRIEANIDVWGFSLSETEMAALKSLDKGPAGRTFNFGVSTGIEDHPEYPM